MGELRLMGRSIAVCAQPWPIVAEVGPRVSAALTNPQGIKGLGGEAYDLMVMLAPDVGREIPRHVWSGFLSQEEMDASEKGYGHGPAPTIPEIIQAFKAALDENGADTAQELAKGLLPGLSGLGKVVGQLLDDDAMATIRAVVSGAVDQAARSFSQASLSPSGTPDQNGGAVSPPSEHSSGDGPSPASEVRSLAAA